MRRKVIIFLIFSVAALVAIYMYNGYPIIIHGNQKEVIALSRPGNLNINPLGSIDFTLGRNYAYLIFSREDREELPVGMRNTKVFICENNEYLQEMKRSFNFLKSNGDMATCESKMLVYVNSKLVFHCALVLTDNQIGLQSNAFGWAEAVDKEALEKIFLKFEPVNSPILVL